MHDVYVCVHVSLCVALLNYTLNVIIGHYKSLGIIVNIIIIAPE